MRTNRIRVSTQVKHLFRPTINIIPIAFEQIIVALYVEAAFRPTIYDPSDHNRYSANVTPEIMPKLGNQHQNLDFKVYQTLKTMIVERKLEPGAKIYQDKLAQDLGVSRTPLVNALKKLEHDKLIFAIPRRGFYVRLVSQEDMIQVFEVREVLEGLAARRAATLITDAQLKKLQHFFHDLPADASDAYAEEDRKFHKFLIEVGGKGILGSILENYNVLTFSYQTNQGAGLIRSPAETLHEHLAIIAAIAEQEPVKAEDAARSHLRNSANRLREQLAAQSAITSENKTN